MSFMRMEIEKKVGGPRIRQHTLGPFHVADTVYRRSVPITPIELFFRYCHLIKIIGDRLIHYYQNNAPD